MPRAQTFGCKRLILNLRIGVPEFIQVLQWVHKDTDLSLTFRVRLEVNSQERLRIFTNRRALNEGIEFVLKGFCLCAQFGEYVGGRYRWYGGGIVRQRQGFSLAC